MCVGCVSTEVAYSETAEKQIQRYERQGFGHLPICMAKTHVGSQLLLCFCCSRDVPLLLLLFIGVLVVWSQLSLSADPNLKGVPKVLDAPCTTVCCLLISKRLPLSCSVILSHVCRIRCCCHCCYCCCCFHRTSSFRFVKFGHLWAQGFCIRCLAR